MAKMGVWRVTADPVSNQDPAVYNVLAPNIPAAAIKAFQLDSGHSDHAGRVKVTIERIVEVDFDPAEVASMQVGGQLSSVSLK